MKQIPFHTYCATGLLLAAALFFAALPAHAAIETWTGTTSSFWNASNWAGTNNPPVNADSIVFTSGTGSGGLTLTDNLFALTSGTLAGITYNSGAAAFIINPATSTNGFTLTGNITNNSNSLETINDAIALNAVKTITMTAGGGNITLGGTISGAAGGITTAGSGTLTFGVSNNTYAGTTTIGAGTTLDIAGTTQSINQIINNGTITSSGSSTGNFTINALTSTAVSGSGNFTGSMNVTLNSPLISTNALLTGSWGNTGNIVLNANKTATISLTGTVNNAGTITNSGTGTAIVKVGSSVSGGLIGSNVTSIIQSGSASLLDLGTNNSGAGGFATGTGTVVITSGTLEVENAGTLGAGNAVSISSRGTLDVQLASTGSETIAGLNTGTGSGNVLSTTSNATLVLGGSNAFSFSGTLKNGASTTLALTVSLTGTGSQTLTGTNTYTGPTTVNSGILQVDGSLSGSSAVTVNAAILQGIGTVSGSVALTGSSTVASSGTLTLAQGFNVSGSSNSLSNGTVTGNAIQNAGSQFAVNGTLNGTDNLLSGASLSGTGSVGATTLNGNNNLGSAGKLIVASLGVNGTGNQISIGTVNATGGTNLANNSGLAVNGTLGGSVTTGSGSVISGTGKLTGALTVSTGARTYPGNGTSAAVLTTDLTYSSGAVAEFGVFSGTTPHGGGAGAGTAYDQIVVTGSSSPQLQIGAGTASAQILSGTLGSAASGVTLTLSMTGTVFSSLQAGASGSYQGVGSNSTLNNYYVFSLGSGTLDGRFQTLELDITGTGAGTYTGTIQYGATGYGRFGSSPGATNTLGDVVVDGQEFALSYTGNYLTNSTIGGNDIVITAIPEPGPWGMMLSGFGMLAGIQKLRKRRVGTRSGARLFDNAPSVLKPEGQLLL